MRQTKYIPGYGYITQYGNGFWADAGKELTFAIGKRITNAIGDKIGRKIAKRITPEVRPPIANTREQVLKELYLLPSNGLPEYVRKALYGSGRKSKVII